MMFQLSRLKKLKKPLKIVLFSFTYKLSFFVLLAFQKLYEKFYVCLSFLIFTLKTA